MGLIFTFFANRFKIFFNSVAKMSNSCDKNDKVHKKKNLPRGEFRLFGRIKTDAPVIIIAKGVRKMIDRISLILVIIGALNWGSIGLFKFDIVAWICGGQGSIVARIIYTLVALAGIWCISLFFRENTLLETNDGKTK